MHWINFLFIFDCEFGSAFEISRYGPFTVSKIFFLFISKGTSVKSFFISLWYCKATNIPVTDLRFIYRNSAKCREGALLGFECLCETLGRLFEP